MVQHLLHNCKAVRVHANSEIQEQITNVAGSSSEIEGFIHEVQYELVNETDRLNLKLDLLFDTGSSISFVKVKFIPQNVMLDCKGISRDFVESMIFI